MLAGGAAGISAAFNTPLAGVVFAIEELSHSFEARTSGTVLTAVIVSGIVTLSLVGNYTYFGTTAAQFDLGSAWLAVVICGVAGGALGRRLQRPAGPAPRAACPERPGRWLVRPPAACSPPAAAWRSRCSGCISSGATYGTGYAQARGLVEGHADLPSPSSC